jgi:hypothetical protein
MAKELAKKYKREILTIGLLLVGVLFYLGISQVYADLMTGEKDILSLSTPSANANHEIWFTKGTAWAVADTLVVEIDEGATTLFDLTGITVGHIDLSYGTNGTETEALLFATPAASTWGVTVSTTADTITFLGPSSGLLPASGNKVKIEIGTNAIGGGTNNQINNPAKAAAIGTADVYKIYITYNTTADTGRCMVAIIEGVTVSATVAESLSFAVASDTTAVCDTGFGDRQDATVSNTSVDFGTLSLFGTFYHGCQDLIIGTNAANGYNITSQENTQLTSLTNTIPDTTCGASACNETTAKPWTDATTYYGFGHTCSAIDVTTTCNPAYSTGNSYRQFASIGEATPETAQAIMTNTLTPTVVTEKGRVEYKIAVSTIQPPGTYQNTITYIATPNF